MSKIQISDVNQPGIPGRYIQECTLRQIRTSTSCVPCPLEFLLSGPSCSVGELVVKILHRLNCLCCLSLIWRDFQLVNGFILWLSSQCSWIILSTQYKISCTCRRHIFNLVYISHSVIYWRDLPRSTADKTVWYRDLNILHLQSTRTRIYHTSQGLIQKLDNLLSLFLHVSFEWFIEPPS